MSTPTSINEKYDIVIAGGELFLISQCLPSTNRVDVRL
jgi:hypothetical protein